ncbi:MAG: penicillin-binding protein 2 [Calditrichaeota bacterium]|nr:MAG: penicillin-binding protein 2 [Calditrichota bacterium]
MIPTNFRIILSRHWAFYLAIVGAIFILAVRFYSLQIVEQNIYREKSEKNSVKVETRIPVRGLIYDRNGRLIADNRPAFSVYLVPALTTPATVSTVAAVLGLKPRVIRQKLHTTRRFQPVKIARHVDQRTLTLLLENKLDLPGLEWKVEPRRNYIFSRSFAHVLGPLGEIGENELGKNPEYEQGDLVGKKGVERVMDAALRGKKGYRYLKVDALGRVVGEVSSGKDTPPIPGKDLYLTIDARLQLYADSLFGDRTGALVAINVQNGEVLTLVSRPNYDLGQYRELWHRLISDTLKPLFDRATQAAYPPGSTFKMVAAIAALNEGIITPYWTAFCPGYTRIGRRVVHCWFADGHGEINLISAIRNSCNVYFFQLGKKIGIDLWSKYSRKFLFGKKTGIELTSENPGLVPSREYYDRKYGPGRWTTGMLANLAIGQGELLVTPLQMAQFAMILANGGVYYPPHLRYRLVDKITGEVENYHPRPHRIEDIKPEVFQFVREGMRQVVAGGTGWRAGVYGLTGAGKTGTAQNPHGKPHAWYIGFAPYENPEIAVAVLVENGGSGGAVAAPIAGKFLRRYFYYRGLYDYQEEQRFLRALWAKRREQARQDSLQAAGALEPETGETPEIIEDEPQ